LLIFAVSAMMLPTTPVLADLIAYTGFENIIVYPKTKYQDTGHADADHALLNNPDQPQVNWAPSAPGAALGFTSFYSNTRDAEGLTDSDWVGVTNTTSDFAMYPEGAQGFQMSDTDGLMTTTLDPVTLDGHIDPAVSVHLFITETGWETDDRIRIWVTVDGDSEIDLFNRIGPDIDAFELEGAWQLLSVSLAGYTTATLRFELDSNAETEVIFVDHVEFTSEIAPVPVPESFLLAGLGLGTASACLRIRRFSHFVFLDRRLAK
jgi:hypothetical protein